MDILSGFDKEKCCGCGACVNACPVQALDYGSDEYGFIIPKINHNLCIDCGKCVKVCPYNNIEEHNKKSLVSYAALNKNKEIAIKSSSGGIFGAIASYFLNQGGIVYGCELTEELKAKHCRIDSIDEFKRVLRSKYIQSYMGDNLCKVRDDLKGGKKVLFSGTPCQVAGLLSYLGKLSESENLYVLDIVCHGVPSQKLFDSYREFIEKKRGSKIQSYTFRYKKRYFNGMKWYSHYSLANHKEYSFNWPEDSYSFYYMKAFTNRDSCYKCPFAKLPRQSDITLCDYWHWDECGVEFKKNSSVSAVIVHTQKGQLLLNDVRNDLTLIQTSIDSIKKYNGCLIHPVSAPKERNTVLKKWKECGYATIDKDFRERNWKNVIKYKIIRIIPDCIINI